MDNMQIKMSTADIMNTLVKPNINIRKVLEAAANDDLKVNKNEIEEKPMTDVLAKGMLDLYSNTFNVIYAPLYDTAYIRGSEHTLTHMFLMPVSATKSYAKTNIFLSGRLPDPNMFIVKGFSVATNIRKEKLDKLMMRFIVIQKMYAEMPLSHLPFEYPDNRIIIPSGAYFKVEIQNESTEEIKDELVLFINGWALRAVQ